VDVAKVAEREARHEKRRIARGEERPEKWKKRMAHTGSAPSAPENTFKWHEENLTHQPDDTEKAVIDLAVQGKRVATISKELGIPVYQVLAIRRSNRIKSIITQRQAQRKQTIDNARDAAEVQALENMLSAGEAIAEAVEQIATGSQQVENLDKLLDIYKDMQDRVGFPVVKRTDSRSTHADLGNPIVARLLAQNQKFRSIDGGKAEVLDAEVVEDKELSTENDTQPNADNIEERTG